MSKQIYLQKLLKVLFVTIMLALVSNDYAGGGSGGDETGPTKSFIIDPDGCPGKWIDMCLNNAPVRYIFGFVFFHYGKTVRRKKNQEDTYGISNGFAWAPKFLAFDKYFKMALGDFSINLVNILFDAIRILPFKIFKNKADLFWRILFLNIAVNFHLLAYKFAQFLKLKLFSPMGILLAISAYNEGDADLIGNTIDILFPEGSNSDRMSALFLILSPRLTFDISEFISFISADKS